MNGYYASSPLRLKSTTRYLSTKAAGVVSAVASLVKENDTLSITITRPDLSEDSFVLCATSVYLEREAPTFSFGQRRTSPIPLPGKLWAETS